MSKINPLVKYFKKINTSINNLLEKNLNKLNFNNLVNLTQNNKIVLTFVAVIVLFISYLSLPNFYKQNQLSIKLKSELLNKLNLNFYFSGNLEYNFFPKPHFVSKNVKIKDELKERGINYRKPEYNADGSPKLGLIKRFNVESAKLKESHKDEPLKGVAIYQRMDKNTGKVRRDIMTFRVITERHREEGRWIHPGRAGDKLMDKAFEWAMNEWDSKILPEVLAKYGT